MLYTHIYMPLSARIWSKSISFSVQRSGRIFLFRISFQLLDLFNGGATNFNEHARSILQILVSAACMNGPSQFVFIDYLSLPRDEIIYLYKTVYTIVGC